MPSPLLIVIGTVVVNAFLLLGEAQPGVRTLTSAWRIAAASFVTIVVAAPLIYPLRTVLADANMYDVDVFANAGVVAGVALALTYLARARFPSLLRSMRSAPLLIVSNGLALATVLRGMHRNASLLNFMWDTVALAGGFGLLLPTFVALCERANQCDVPAIFRRTPITFITAGLLALALMGFTGIV